MKLVFLFAMEEEAKIVETFCSDINWIEYKGFKIFEFSYSTHSCVAIISGIGISLSAAAAALCIEKYNPDAIINIGLAGGINCKLGDIIISKTAIFHDADVTALNYPIHQLPNLPLKITSYKDLIIDFNLTDFEITKEAIVFSGNQFVNNKIYVDELKNKYPTTAAIEMEAASIAAICFKAQCAFLFIKKISDLADENAANTFKFEIPNFNAKTKQILLQILNNAN